jgi:hypothetical protein
MQAKRAAQQGFISSARRLSNSLIVLAQGWPIAGES